MIELSPKKCIAFTRLKTPCPDLAERDSKWCSTHEELQGKCMRIYKHHSRELDRYAVDNPYPGFDFPGKEKPASEHQIDHMTAEKIPRSSDVNQLDDVQKLRAWYQIARRTWALANRTVLAREHHHAQFYQDGDDSHRHFNAILRHKQAILEELMSEIDQRLFRLTIGIEEADWLLSKQPNDISSPPESDERFSCSESSSYEVDCQEDQAMIEPPPTPPSSPTPCKECEYTSEDPEEKLKRMKKTVMRQLINYLDFPNQSNEIFPTVSKELKEIIRNIFRRIIVRDAGLFVRAKEFDPTANSLPNTCMSGPSDWLRSGYQCPIKAFITSDHLSLKELERLWALMKFGKDKIGPELIRNSIADIYRFQDGCMTEQQSTNIHSKKATKIWVLGGFVWRKAKEGPLPRAGSDFLHAFVGCAGCMLSTCRTFSEWIDNRRLALVDYRYVGWAEPKEQPVERLFRCIRVVVCRHNCRAKLSRVEKIVPKSKKLKTVYTETQERHYLHLCMSLKDPRAEKVICALHSQPANFNVYAQRRDTGMVTHKPISEDDLWFSRIRSGYSTSERKKKRFTPATAFKADKELFEKNLISPEGAFKHRFLDCWDVLVMDAKVGEFQAFLDSIARLTLEVIGCNGIEEALENESQQSSDLSREANERLGKWSLVANTTASSSTLVESFMSSLRHCRSLFREPVINDPPGSTSWL